MPVLSIYLLAAIGAAEGSLPTSSLEDVINTALAEAETPQIAYERVRQARASAREAWAALLPNLQLGVTYRRRAFEVEVTREDENGVVLERGFLQALNAFSGQARLTSTLFEARAIPDISAAEDNLTEAKVNLHASRFALAHEVAEAYVDVQVAESTLRAARQRLEVAREDTRSAGARLDAGLIANVDRDRSEIESLTAEVLVTRLEESVRVARLRLGFLVGQDVGAKLAELKIEVPAFQEDLLVEEALSQRPEIAAARAALKEAADRALAPWLDLLPSLQLDAIVTGTNETGFNGRTLNWNLALNLNWTLYDGGLRYAEAQDTAAAKKVAQLQLRQLERTVRDEVRAGLLAIKTVQADLQLATRRVVLTRRYAGEVRARNARGLATAVEAADAAVSAYEAEVSAATGEAELSRVMIRLRRAVGRWPTQTVRPSSRG